MEGEQLHDSLLLSDNEPDSDEISSCGQLVRYAAEESKALWRIAGPVVFTSIAQYSINASTQVFAGHLTVLELDAVSNVNMVIGGLAFGIMLGMGSALETLCGQAYGAKQLNMLGVYMQRSWVILTVTCIFLLPLYVFATPILRALGQDEEIAVLAGRFALYMIPQHLSLAGNFPIQKFLQAQSKVMAMAVTSAAVLVLHIFMSWLLIVHLKLGLEGAAFSLDISWWLLLLGQFAYIAMGSCPGAWNGFSWEAFRDLWEFAKLSIASGIMLCLESWFLTILILLVGLLKNAQIAVAAMSICINLHGWVVTLFIGFNAAISVRTSNELGTGRPRAVKFAILVVSLTSLLLGLIFFTLVMALKDVCGVPFTNNPEVVRAVSDLAVVFAFTVLLDTIQPILTGVAVGAGWQWLVAYIDLGCYYVLGLPIGTVLAYYLGFGAKGMWSGLLAGMGLQTLILIGITVRTDWNKEVKAAESRIKKWGGSVDEPINDSQKA